MPGLNPTAQDFEKFFEITGADYNEAQRFLESGTTLEGAIEDYFATKAAGDAGAIANEDDTDEALLDDELMADEADRSSGPAQAQGQAPAPSQGSGAGGYTLDGQRVDSALPEGWGRPERRTGRIGEWGGGQQTRRAGGIATLWNGGLSDSDPPGGHDDDDDEADGEARRGGETLYAGGGRSGLAIQNPDQGNAGRGGPRGIVENILRQASDNTRSREAEPATRANDLFRGVGNVLGSEDTPSPSAADHTASPPTAVTAQHDTSSSGPGGLLGALMGRFGGPPPEEEAEPQTRRLTFWSDGFSIEDGPLHAYEAPGNRELLEAIQSGRAPPSLFNVRYNQPIQIEVSQRTNEAYRPPPKAPLKAFEGQGNRLGSPAPEIVGNERSTPVMPGAIRGDVGGSARSSVAPARSQGQGQGGFEVDSSKPTTNIQIRLGDGTRIIAKVNLTHRVGDLKNYVSAARPDTRPFVLQTTFPSKELDDPNLTIEEAKLQNAVVVQRFT